MTSASPAPSRARSQRARVVVTLVAALAIAAACKIKLVADYDKAAEDGLLQAYGKIERLYDAMSQDDSAGRTYARYADRYAEINEMIRVQVVREAARPLNSESFGIVSTIDTVFTSYRERHKRDTVYNAALLPLHRDRLRRMFVAALKAERVKQDRPDEE